LADRSIPPSKQEVNIQQLKSRIEADPFARFLGIELVELGQGYSRMAMTLQPQMVNFHGIPHGGAIFSLADAAFAAASNSHGQVAVALSMTINYRTAVSPGTRLLAEAVEVSLGGRTGLYRITVTTADSPETLVAVCDGTVYRKKELIEGSNKEGHIERRDRSD
jgi:acyl-CoA thioesterase